MRALITGAANGIGRAIANELAAAGYSLVLLDVDELNLETTAKELGQKYAPLTVESQVVDITDETAVTVAATKVLKAGPIDVLVNNAGIGHYETVAKLQPTDFRQQLEVNLTGAFIVTHAFLPSMIAQKKGQIVNIGSRHSYETTAGRSAYCASKFGLRGLSFCLTAEVEADNIEVTILEPHSVVTNFNNALADKQARVAKGEPFLQPEQVAQLVVELVTKKREWAREVRIGLKPDTKELLVESLK